MTLTDYIYQEKEEEEDSQALNMAFMHQYEDSKTTLKMVFARPPI